MPREINVNSIRDRIPVRYRFSPLVRWTMILFASLVMVYTLYFMIRYVNADTPITYKLLPVAILYVCLSSLLRHLTTLNSIVFYPEQLQFTYILKKKIEIPYVNILNIELYKRLTYYVHIRYQDENGREQLFKTSTSFPKILEIILNISDLSPNIQLTGKMGEALEQLRSQAKMRNDEPVR